MKCIEKINKNKKFEYKFVVQRGDHLHVIKEIKNISKYKLNRNDCLFFTLLAFNININKRNQDIKDMLKLLINQNLILPD